MEQWVKKRKSGLIRQTNSDFDFVQFGKLNLDLFEFSAERYLCCCGSQVSYLIGIISVKIKRIDFSLSMMRVRCK